MMSAVLDGSARTVHPDRMTSFRSARHALLVAAGFAGFPGEGSPSGGPS